MPIYATIRQNGERATFTTGKYIHPNEWDSVRQKAKGKSETAQAINATLLQLRNKIYRKELETYSIGIDNLEGVVEVEYLLFTKKCYNFVMICGSAQIGRVSRNAGKGVDSL